MLAITKFIEVGRVSAWHLSARCSLNLGIQILPYCTKLFPIMQNYFPEWIWCRSL